MSHHHGESHEGELGHIVPTQVYVKVILVLFVLTAITVVASRFDFGTMNLVVAMVIASIKAGIVGLFFMHLKYENPLIWIYVAFPIVLLGIMIGGIFIDNPYRNDPKIYYTAPVNPNEIVDKHH